MDSILSQPLKSGYQDFLDLCQDMGADLDAVENEARLVLGILGTKTGSSDEFSMRGTRPLEVRWYESLERGEPDYGVYDGDDYLGEMWASWAFYARKYLHLIEKSRLLYDLPRQGARILDLGCGSGHTTAALSQMVPGSLVTGTNLEGSRQMAMARKLGEEYGFQMIGSGPLAGCQDIVFASEYFEHIHDPITHLIAVLDLNPRLLIAANTFSRPSVGHFDATGYSVFGQSVPNRAVSRMFSQVLRDRGYEKLETGFWNNRPAVWRRTR